MTTRAQELLTCARVFATCAERYGHPFDALALDAARAAILATLRKQQLRLAYFEPERERLALLHDLRIVLDTSA